MIHQRTLGLCYKRAEVALDFIGFKAASLLVAVEGPFLTAFE